MVQRIFGYYALQLEFDQINFLQGNKISNRYIVNHKIKTRLNFLPFAENSIDLIICPHILEFTPNYHHVLQECYRVLIPNGRIIFTCFNSNSLLALMLHRKLFFKQAKFISLNILKEQLKTLNFEIDGGKFLSYTPPCRDSKLLSKLTIVDKIGARWLPAMANVFAITATKQLLSHNLLINPKLNIPDISITTQLGTTCSNKNINDES